jgi:hypothetical protein
MQSTHNHIHQITPIIHRGRRDSATEAPHTLGNSVAYYTSRVSSNATAGRQTCGSAEQVSIPLVHFPMLTIGDTVVCSISRAMSVLRYRLAAICAHTHGTRARAHTYTHTHTPCYTAAQETLLQRQQEIAAERAKAGLTADGRPLSSQSIWKTRVASAGTEHVSLPDDVRGITVSGTTPNSTDTSTPLAHYHHHCHHPTASMTTPTTTTNITATSMVPTAMIITTTTTITRPRPLSTPHERGMA